MNPNIQVKSNVWINKDSPNETWAHEAARWIPGDLMVEFIGTRDKLWLERGLTKKQMDEYLAYRFFLYRGQEGLAFDSGR